MNQKFTAEEAQHLSQRLKSGEYDGTVIMRAWIALEAYADSIERAQAGVTDEVVERATVAYARTASKHIPVSAVSMRATLLDVWPNPPAQAVQVDLRNGLLRGKAQNEEPRVRHSCNIGVGCEETGICYAEANGQPEQCGRPTAEPVAQPAGSGRSYATSWTDEEKARAFEWLRAAATADGAPMEAGVALDTWHALAVQGRGEPVAWLAADGSGRVIEVKAKSAGARASATASATSVYSIPLYAAPPIDIAAVREVIAGLRTNADDLDRIDVCPMLATHLRNGANKLEAAIK
jgi:hypothetical protein